MELNKTRTNTHYLNYYIVLPTHYQVDIFETEAEQKVISNLLYSGAKSMKATINDINIHPSYIELYISFSPKLSITQVVKTLKSGSAKPFLIMFPYKRHDLHKASQLWERHFYIQTVGETNPTITESYLKSLPKSNTTSYNKGIDQKKERK